MDVTPTLGVNHVIYGVVVSCVVSIFFVQRIKLALVCRFFATSQGGQHPQLELVVSTVLVNS